MNMIRTVLFDLDGTLLDTAPDLAFALNASLQAHGFPVLPFNLLRPKISHGASALIKQCAGIDEQHPQFASLLKRMLDIYSEHLADQTTLFDGIEELLTHIESRGMTWGIVTNKPKRFTDPLLQKMNLLSRAVCHISGDSLPHKKPHPAPLLHACMITQSAPAQCVYVGDAITDVEAGKKAGMHVLVALYGYLDTHDEPTEWEADGLLTQPIDLIKWLERF